MRRNSLKEKLEKTGFVMCAELTGGPGFSADLRGRAGLKKVVSKSFEP